MGRTEADRQIYERAVVVDAGAKENNKNTPRSEWRSVLKKSLTEPTLLEMSGNPTYQDLASDLCYQRQSSVPAEVIELRKFAGPISHLAFPYPNRRRKAV